MFEFIWVIASDKVNTFAMREIQKTNQEKFYYAHEALRLGDFSDERRKTEQLKVYMACVAEFTPCLQFFFLEHFKTADRWFDGTRTYTYSLAINSMIGHLLGIGDRHTGNLLLDPSTGDVFVIE